MTPPLALIAAVGRNGVIGAEGTLPWRLPSDLKHFRRLTLGKPVIMGRKTFQSIGRPLPGRFVIAVSRDPHFAPEGIETATTLDQALERASALAGVKNASEIMVAGGGTLYEALIDRADRLYVTTVDLSPAGDTRFPAIDPARWRESSHDPQERAAGDDAAFTFLTYETRRIA